MTENEKLAAINSLLKFPSQTGGGPREHGWNDLRDKILRILDDKSTN